MITASLLLLPVVLAAADGAPARDVPRLVVLVSVDQLFPEQLDRLDPWLEGGLGRLWRDGTVYRSAALTHAATETGPGHVTLATGCVPARHGVVGNGYYDRGLRAGVYCVGDAAARTVDGEGPRERVGSVSPANLLVPTIGDRLREARPGARVFSVAGKDRSAVGMGGWSAAPALWWDKGGAGFVTSDVYGDALPEWVRRWNTGWVDAARTWTWEPTFPGDPTSVGTDADERPGEVPFQGQGTSMPYEMPANIAPAGLAGATYGSPLVDRFTLEVARLAVDELELGADETPDLLIVGLSACDTVGHAFGPYSWEVTDLLLRLDRRLGALFEHLDVTVGEGAWAAALTSDHGVLELPEALQARGVGARRVPRAGIGEAAAAARAAMSAEFPGLEARTSFDGRAMTLDEAAVRGAGIEPAAVRAALARGLESVDWIEAAYTLEDLTGAGDADPWLDLYRNSSHPDRAPDVAVRAVPWSLVNLGRGTSHGSVYPYDRRIPLVFFGPAFPARREFGPASSADVAPTMLELVGVPFDADAFDGRSRLR